MARMESLQNILFWGEGEGGNQEIKICGSFGFSTLHVLLSLVYHKCIASRFLRHIVLHYTDLEEVSIRLKGTFK